MGRDSLEVKIGYISSKFSSAKNTTHIIEEIDYKGANP